MSTTFDPRSMRLVAAPCGLCGASAFSPLMRGDRYGFGLQTQGCRQCGLIQTHPRPTDHEIEVFYRQHYRRYYQDTATPDSSYVRRFGKDARMAYTAQLIVAALEGRESPALLDCGCGEGTLFTALRSAGFRGAMFGVEPNASFARHARERGATGVYASLDEAVSSGHRFDLIVLIHVLEHFTDPVSALARLRATASGTATLYVDVPDAEQYASINDLHVAHLYHFDARTLAATLGAAGWSAAAVLPHAPPHHPKSLRAVARPGPAQLARPAAQECGAAWRAVRRLRRDRWRLGLRSALGRVPGARALWRTIRRAQRGEQA